MLAGGRRGGEAGLGAGADQSEVSMGSRDLASANHSSPGAEVVHGHVAVVEADHDHIGVLGLIFTLLSSQNIY